MDASGDIARIIAQEKALALDRFDEAFSFELGSKVREIALSRGLGIVVEVAAWDKRHFFAATPGSAGSNVNWARRKLNVVRMFSKASYRLVLEQPNPERLIATAQGLSVEDYVLAGGGFPLRVANAGIVGAVAVSGLPEREDHNLVVEALCAVLGKDHAALKLDA